MVPPPVSLLSNMAYYIIINHAGTVQVLAISYLSHYHFSSTHILSSPTQSPREIITIGCGSPFPHSMVCLSRGQTRHVLPEHCPCYQCCPLGKQLKNSDQESSHQPTEALAPTTHSDPNTCGGDWLMNIH